MSNLDAIRARPALAGRRRSERTCCLVFKDRCATRALPPGPIQALKKPLRRRGPKTAAYRGCPSYSPVRRVELICSQPPFPEATGEFSNKFGSRTGLLEDFQPPSKAAREAPARQYRLAPDGARLGSPGAASGRQAHPAELAPAHLQDPAVEPVSLDVELVRTQRLPVEADPSPAQQPAGLAA
jgi:hypothetical protein